MLFHGRFKGFCLGARKYHAKVAEHLQQDHPPFQVLSCYSVETWQTFSFGHAYY